MMNWMSEGCENRTLKFDLLGTNGNWLFCFKSYYTCCCVIIMRYYVVLSCVIHTGRLSRNFSQNSRNIVFAKIWHSMALMALQDTKKPIEYWKRPTKAEKVILKAGESKNGKIMIFFAFCDHLITKIKGIQYFDVSRSKRPKRPHQ